MKTTFSKEMPKNLEAIKLWINNLAYPEILEQIILYEAHIKTYGNAPARLFPFIGMVAAGLKILFPDELVLSYKEIIFIFITAIIVSIFTYLFCRYRKGIKIGTTIMTIILPILFSPIYLHPSPKASVLAIFFYYLHL